MATSHYNFPTINGTDTIDGVNAINGLANSVDAALFGVAGDIPEAYALPVAGTTSLGGVRGSGDISVNASTGDMALNDGTVTAGKLTAGAVTTDKVLNGAVTSEKLASGVATQINNGNNAWVQWSGKTSAIGTAMTSGCTACAWGNVVTVECSNVSVPGNQKTKIGTLGAQYAPAVTATASRYLGKCFYQHGNGTVGNRDRNGRPDVPQGIVAESNLGRARCPPFLVMEVIACRRATTR